MSAASWYTADVMEVYEEAVASGAEFNTSDALTINGQPGALFDCSTGIFRKWTNLVSFYFYITFAMAATQIGTLFDGMSVLTT